MFIEIKAQAGIFLGELELDHDVLINLDFVSAIHLGKRYLNVGELDGNRCDYVEFRLEGGGRTESLVLTFRPEAMAVYRYVRELIALRSFKDIQRLKEP